MQEVKAVHDKVRNGHNIQLPNKLADSDNTADKGGTLTLFKHKQHVLHCEGHQGIQSGRCKLGTGNTNRENVTFLCNAKQAAKCCKAHVMEAGDSKAFWVMVSRTDEGKLYPDLHPDSARGLLHEFRDVCPADLPAG